MKKNTGLLLCLTAGMVFATSGRTAESPLLAQADIFEHEMAASLYEQGVRRINGEGGTQDIAQGRYWIHLAARHGYPLAQYNLGVMYFDGISGAYNRQCAQWWLTRAAAQDDPEVYPMAQQALQSIVPEMALLPKVYRPVTAVECDRLPAWLPTTDVPILSLAAVEAVSVIPELPDGDVGTEERGIEQEAPVSSAADDATDMGEEATGSVGAEVQIDMAQGSIAETETTAENPPEQVAGVTPETTVHEGISAQGAAPEGGVLTDKALEIAAPADSEVGKAEEAAVSGDATLPHPADDTAEEAVAPPEGSERSVSELPPPSALGESAVTAPQASDGTEKLPAVPQIEVPVKVKTQKQRVVIPESVLNLGGSPATAPGKHYTLQLSGGTTPEELYRMARKHKLTNYVVYETERHGRRWYVLVAGEYATLSSANQAIKHLQAELRKNRPWVRSVKLVQNELSENEAGVINADNHQSKLKP